LPGGYLSPSALRQPRLSGEEDLARLPPRRNGARFIAFRSHWNFEASFCTPGEGHEKGGVEGEVGTFRRNHLVPVPAARDLDDLNGMLLAGCREDETRVIDGRVQPVGEALKIQR